MYSRSLKKPIVRILILAETYLLPGFETNILGCRIACKFVRERSGLDIFWPRLRAKRQQRDEALNEIRVAHFLDSRGYPVIDWEPIDVGDRKLEYAVAKPRAGKPS